MAPIARMLCLAASLSHSSNSNLSSPRYPVWKMHCFISASFMNPTCDQTQQGIRPQFPSNLQTICSLNPPTTPSSGNATSLSGSLLHRTIDIRFRLNEIFGIFRGFTGQFEQYPKQLKIYKVHKITKESNMPAQISVSFF